MGDIRIPATMAQMDGFFGCKVVRQKNQDGTEVDVFKKKDFIDWVFDIVFNLEAHPVTREKTVAALDNIAGKIKDAETGDFKALVDTYRSADIRIDFKEIRKTLAASLSWEFPPRVFSGNSCDLTLVNAYKDAHFKNMKKSICLEKTSMPLISDARYGEITEDSIQGYCEMLHSIFLTGIDPIRPVMDRQTEIRILLATAKMDKESKTEGHGNMDAEIGKLNIELAGLSKTTSVETRENFEEIYLAKLRKSVDDKIYNIEIFADTHGDISEENIDAFSKALVQIEASEARKFEISIPAGAREENADIKIRLNEAYVAARIAHFEKSSTAGAM